MRGRSGWLVIGAAAVLGLTAVASEKPPESYVKNMKDTNAEAAELRKSVEVKNYDATAQHAATLKTLFANTLSFWENRKTDDAVGFAKAGIKAATDLESAAKAKNVCARRQPILSSSSGPKAPGATIPAGRSS